MNQKEVELIKQQIRNLEELIKQANADNSNIKGWKQEIANLKSRLSF